MAKTDFLPCPMCGKEAASGTVTYDPQSDTARLNGQHKFYFVKCIYCGVNNQSLIGWKTPEAAAEHWNQRTAGKL